MGGASTTATTAKMPVWHVKVESDYTVYMEIFAEYTCNKPSSATLCAFSLRYNTTNIISNVLFDIDSCELDCVTPIWHISLNEK